MNSSSSPSWCSMMSGFAARKWSKQHECVSNRLVRMIFTRILYLWLSVRWQAKKSFVWIRNHQELLIEQGCLRRWFGGINFINWKSCVDVKKNYTIHATKLYKATSCDDSWRFGTVYGFMIVRERFAFSMNANNSSRVTSVALHVRGK